MIDDSFNYDIYSYPWLFSFYPKKMSLSTIVLGVILLVISLLGERYVRRWRYVQKAKRLHVKPLPLKQSVWKLANSRRNMSDGRFLHRLEKTFDGMGMSCAFEIGSNRIVMTEDPEIAKTCLSTSFKDYDIGQRKDALSPLLKNGIFTQNGEPWKHSRAMIRPLFAKEQLSQLHVIDARFEVLLDKVRDNVRLDQQPFDILPLLQCFTMDTITEYLFGESVNSLKDPLIPAHSDRPVQPAEFSDSFSKHVVPFLSKRLSAGKLNWIVDGFTFRKHVNICHRFIDYYVERAIDNAKQGKQDPDRFIFVQELAKETSDAVFIRQQATSVLFAGRGTTALLLSYSLYRLGINKDIFAKLKQVVLEEFGRDKANITYEALRRCTYLNYFINEVLRLNPIVPFNVKRAIKDTVLPRGGGEFGTEPCLLQKGDAVMVFTFGMLRSRALWGEDAREFKPDRWADGRRGWDYIPFGGGPRICVGQQFALTEGAYCLVRMMQEFKGVDIVPDQENPHDPKVRFLIGASLFDGARVTVEMEEEEEEEC